MSAWDRLVKEQRERLEAAGINSGATRVSIQLGSKVSAMALRGLAVKARLRSSAGIPLIGKGVRIRNPQFIDLGRDVLVEDFAEIQGLSAEGITLGDRVSIGTGVLIRPSSYYSREIGVGLTMGAGSSLSPHCYIGCSGGIDIGEDVMLGPGVRLFAEDHRFAESSESIKSQGVERGRIRIGAGSWIASGATITSGVTIGERVVVAAGAVVTKDVPDDTLVAGVPAREIRNLRTDT